MTTSGRPGASADLAAARQLAARTNADGGTYHQLDLGADLRIDGDYDMTKYLRYYHLPERLDGVRMLDVGTASGFFAIECARRGASVTAIDIWPADCLLAQLNKIFGLGIDYVTKDVYDLDSSFGQFDLVVCGSLITHLPDPVGALGAMRTVTGGRLILSTTTTPDSAHNADPVCHFIGQHANDGDYWAYWGLSAAALTRMLLATDFARIEDIEHFGLATERGRVQYTTPHVALSAYVRETSSA